MIGSHSVLIVPNPAMEVLQKKLSSVIAHVVCHFLICPVMQEV
jgi:hypothetical protein